jgi:hypothetical protein
MLCTQGLAVFQACVALFACIQWVVYLMMDAERKFSPDLGLAFFTGTATARVKSTYRHTCMSLYCASISHYYCPVH